MVWRGKIGTDIVGTLKYHLSNFLIRRIFPLFQKYLWPWSGTHGILCRYRYDGQVEIRYQCIGWYSGLIGIGQWPRQPILTWWRPISSEEFNEQKLNSWQKMGLSIIRPSNQSMICQLQSTRGQGNLASSVVKFGRVEYPRLYNLYLWITYLIDRK